MTSKLKLSSLAAVSGLSLAVAGLAATTFAGAPPHAEADPDASLVMKVAMTPSCGCCGAWVDLAREENYRVEAELAADHAGMKKEASVPEDLWSCHTTKIAGYTVEGHVPFEAIQKLLDEQPGIDGIAVPGMPAGSPGMGTDPSASFEVIGFGGSAGDGAVVHTAGG